MAPDGNRTRATFGGRRALSPLRHSSFFGTSFLFFILPFYLREKIKLGEILQVESNYVHSAWKSFFSLRNVPIRRKDLRVWLKGLTSLKSFESDSRLRPRQEFYNPDALGIVVIVVWKIWWSNPTRSVIAGKELLRDSIVQLKNKIDTSCATWKIQASWVIIIITFLLLLLHVLLLLLLLLLLLSLLLFCFIGLCNAAIMAINAWTQYCMQ